MSVFKTLTPLIATLCGGICALCLVLIVLALAGCDGEDTWEEVKPMLTDALIDAALTAKSDPAVLRAMAAGDYEEAAQAGMHALKVNLRNTATSWASGGELERKAYDLVNDEWPLVGAMISRPGGEGLWWRLDAWLRGKGHATGLEGGILAIELSAEEMDELWPLALVAIDEEYKAARAYLRETAADSTDGIDTGDEW